MKISWLLSAVGIAPVSLRMNVLLPTSYVTTVKPSPLTCINAITDDMTRNTTTEYCSPCHVYLAAYSAEVLELTVSRIDE